jgi:DNA adenine methylase
MNQQEQISLFPDFREKQVVAPRPVNIVTIPHRSPFRYPGGKTWFVPIFRRWLAGLVTKPAILVEPFVGGGIISLTALFEDLVDKAVMVELDPAVAAVWQAIVGGDAAWLADKIVNFEMTRDAAIAELNQTPTNTKEQAFQTILKNRTLHGGILAEGSGLIRYGENGKGVASRWYPHTLAKRLLDMEQIRARMDFRCTDSLPLLPQFAPRQDTVYFIDPPYTAGGKSAGKRLYTHHQLDHEQLFQLCHSLAGDFLMTYDEADEVKALARRHGFQMRLVPMKNTHHATKYELIIGKNLTWLDELPTVREPMPTYNTA